VVPPQAEPWLLEALAGEQAGRLDECLASGMLVAEPAGVAFRHELARLAVEASVPPHRKLGLHRAALLERRSNACYLTDQNDAVVEAIQEALECRRQLGQRLEEGDALCWLSKVLWFPGRTAEAEDAAREAVTLLEALPPGREPAMAYANLGAICAQAARSEEAVGWAGRALELAERLDDTQAALPARLPGAPGARPGPLGRGGRLRRGRPSGPPYLGHTAHLRAGGARAPPGAARRPRPPGAPGGGVGVGGADPGAAARAEAAWLEGDRHAVAEATQAALQLALERRWGRLAGELALWRRCAGLGHEIPTAGAGPYALQLAGDWARAAERWCELGCPYEAALALADAGEEAPLRRALDELQRLGARPAAAIVARRLRERGALRLPRGPRPATRRNPAGLTPRELEVLALLAGGLRYADIAARLVLSERTVGHHVGAILRKLGVRTRAEASAEAVRLGLIGQGG
jgi:DNA-binding CsgD family transcriptional regulator